MLFEMIKKQLQTMVMKEENLELWEGKLSAVQCHVLMTNLVAVKQWMSVKNDDGIRRVGCCFART
jgi:hypothetical protein